MHFFDIVGSDLNPLSPPSNPPNFNTDVEITYVPGDTLWQDYDNGFVYWYLYTAVSWQVGSL